MTSDTLRAFLRAGIFVLVTGIALTLLNQPGTAEYVVSICSALIGAALVAGVALIGRLMR
jgi:hypothetical protein